MNKDDSQNPAHDDAELNKVLEGINDQGAGATLPSPTDGLQFEETPAAAPVLPGADPVTTDDTTGEPAAETAVETAVEDPSAPVVPEIPTVEVVADEPVYPVINPDPAPAEPTLPSVAAPAAPSGPLEDIKKNALEELRPLVDKLDLPADEKFDTLLLIIRSTDDQSLVNACYEAAKQIEDETKRAQALLDVIKEIDYFANQK